MSIETTVLTGLSQEVDVQQVDRLAEGKSFDFVPHGYPLPHKYGMVTGQGHFMTRFNDARVLRLSLRSETVCEFVDMLHLQGRVNDRNAHAMFGKVRVVAKKTEGQSVFQVVVEHTIGLRGANGAFVASVMADMVHLYDDTMLIVADEIKRELRNQAAEARELTQQLRELPGVKKELTAVLDELNSLVGLSEVKSFVNGLVAQQRVAGLRHLHGLPMVASSPHLVFVGNPGTGKTTVARLIGRIYKGLGLLETGNVVEVDRASLVGVHLGQTAIKTKEVCEKALGGVLFIDEAYSLAVDGRDYGTEAIEALLTFMEEHRGNIAVVMAGYPDEMQKFLHSNPGLNSRFDATVHFADYSGEDLLQIFMNLVTANSYELTPGALCDMKAVFAHVAATDATGNARDVRKIFNDVIAEHAKNVTTLKHPTKEQLTMITATSIPRLLTREIAISVDDLPPI